MAEINLGNGLVAKVDDHIRDEVLRYRWRIQPGGRTFNAVRTDDDGQVQTMQRFVMSIAGTSIPGGRRIRHINGDGLDNRMENLRVRIS